MLQNRRKGRNKCFHKVSDSFEHMQIYCVDELKRIVISPSKRAGTFNTVLIKKRILFVPACEVVRIYEGIIIVSVFAKTK